MYSPPPRPPKSVYIQKLPPNLCDPLPHKKRKKRKENYSGLRINAIEKKYIRANFVEVIKLLRSSNRILLVNKPQSSLMLF